LTLRLNSFISSIKELGLLAGKVKQLRAYQTHYAQIVPLSLLRSSQVIQLEQTVLTVSANNGAVAAKLRQMAPELLGQLQQRGCEVTAIQVKVQVTQTVLAKPPSRFLISSKSKQQISELSDKLPPSPLRNALQRLIEKKQRQ